MSAEVQDVAIVESSSSEDAAVCIIFELFSEWYGIPPVWQRLSEVKGEHFEALWTKQWFAKGALTAPLDAHLRQQYASAFSIVEPYITSGIPEAPVGLSPLNKKTWLMGLLILCDQVSRNVFRNSARAYRTDALARRLAAPFLAEFDTLPAPIRVSLILVLVHSEDPSDWGMTAVQAECEEAKTEEDLVSSHLARAKPQLENCCHFVFESLSRIATNHRDRMKHFGRVPERNSLLGRESSQQELVYMEAMGSV